MRKGLPAKTDGERRPTTINFPVPMREKLIAIAEERDISLSKLVRGYCLRGMADDAKEQSAIAAE